MKGVKGGVKKPLLERFWEKVAVIDDAVSCWEWLAARNEKGYGRFQVASRQAVAAHRFIFNYLNRDCSHLLVCHKCNNPACVRPDHLYAGTPKENTRDMLAAGTQNMQRKTHCKNGHAFTPENTRLISTHLAQGKNHRVCKTCSLEGLRRSRANRRAVT